jgi:hypothetical protein
MKTNRTSHWRALAGCCAGVLALAALTNPCRAQEHPTEHPHSTSPKAAKPNVTLKDVAAYTEKYVKDHSQDGLFRLKDKTANQDLALKLDRVHRDRLAQVGPALYFVCADFKTPDGQHTYDLDFFVQGSSKDQLAVQEDKTSVHKQDGKARYTWALNKGTGMWEQKPVPAP